MLKTLKPTAIAWFERFYPFQTVKDGNIQHSELFFYLSFIREKIN